MTDLFLESGEKAGLFDVCRWWIETYPSDVFVSEPKSVVEIRLYMQDILSKEKCEEGRRK